MLVGDSISHIWCFKINLSSVSRNAALYELVKMYVNQFLFVYVCMGGTPILEWPGVVLNFLASLMQSAFIIFYTFRLTQCLSMNIIVYVKLCLLLHVCCCLKSRTSLWVGVSLGGNIPILDRPGAMHTNCFIWVLGIEHHQHKFWTG